MPSRSIAQSSIRRGRSGGSRAATAGSGRSRSSRSAVRPARPRSTSPSSGSSIPRFRRATSSRWLRWSCRLPIGRIAKLDQSPTTSLPLRDEVEPGPIEMVGPRCVPAAVSPRVNAGTCAAARAQYHHVQQRRCPTRRHTAPRSTGRRTRRVQQIASVPLTSCS
jgi:hypothetical protein